LVEARHYKRARPALEARVQANPNDAQAAYLLSKVKQAFHDYDGALPLAEKAVALNPRSSAYHLQLAFVVGDIAQKANKLAQFGHARRFRKEVETALALDPKSVDARLAMISYYLEAPGIMGGDRQKAEAMAQEILAINPARGYLAQARLAGKDAEKQSRPEFLARLQGLYEKAVAADPKSLDARVALANLYFDGAIKKYELGEQQGREVLKLDPDRAAGYSLLAVAFVLQERWSDLDAILAQSEKAIPDNLSPYFNAGRNLIFVSKDLPRAERYFRKYLAQEPEGSMPSHSRAQWQLGLALEKQGRKPEAIAALETAVRMDGSFEPAKKDLKRLKG
jgi:tetratricopeptide (TPR) repeat protein